MKDNLKSSVLSLYQAGNSGIKIATMLNRHPSTIYYYLKGYSKPNGGLQAKSSGDEIEILYKHGFSCAQIAEKLGLKNSGTVYTRLKNRGVKIRSKSEGMAVRGCRKIGPDDEILEKYQQGLSQVEIAKDYDVYSDSIRHVLKRHNANEGSKGKRNPSWKGGVTKLNSLIRYSPKWRELREKVITDRGACQISGDTQCEYNLHHIVHFKFLIEKFVRDFSIDIENLDTIDRVKLWNDIEKFSLFWDPQNLILLSQDIHDNIHDNLEVNFNRSNKEMLSVKKIASREANLLLDFGHYLGSSPKAANICYGLFLDSSLIGCCVFGKGANQHLSSGAGGEALELVRLYTVDWAPKNSLSFFMARVIKLFKREHTDIKYLVSFADPNVGHSGTVYKACNWIYTGQIKKDYKYLLSNGSLVHKSKFRCKDGKTEKELAKEAGAIKVHQKGKHRFVLALK